MAQIWQVFGGNKVQRGSKFSLAYPWLISIVQLMIGLASRWNVNLKLMFGIMILRNLKSFWTKSKCVTSNLTNQCTRIATARFYNGYALAKKWVIGATLASPQSRDFKRSAGARLH